MKMVESQSFNLAGVEEMEQVGMGVEREEFQEKERQEAHP